MHVSDSTCSVVPSLKVSDQRSHWDQFLHRLCMSMRMSFMVEWKVTDHHSPLVNVDEAHPTLTFPSMAPQQLFCGVLCDESHIPPADWAATLATFRYTSTTNKYSDYGMDAHFSSTSTLHGSRLDKE